MKFCICLLGTSQPLQMLLIQLSQHLRQQKEGTWALTLILRQFLMCVKQQLNLVFQVSEVKLTGNLFENSKRVKFSVNSPRHCKSHTPP